MHTEFEGKRALVSRSASGRTLKAGAVLALAAATVSASAMTAGAATRSKSKSCESANGVKVTVPAVCQGLSYFKGKTVTFIAPTSSGSAYDVEARAFVKEMGAYLGATIDVTDISTGATVAGQDQLAASAPNGLTIGFFNMASNFYDTISNTPGVNFNIKNVTLFGGLPNNTDILATQSTSPYTSFAVLRKTATTAKPAKILFSPGAAATENILLLKEFGIPATYVTGYSTSSQLTTGFLRGDGQLDGSGIASLQGNIEAGNVRVLAIETQAVKPSTTIPMYSTLKKFPTVGQLLKKYPAKTNGEKAAVRYASIVDKVPNFVVGGPAGLSSNLAKTFDAATQYAAKTTYVKTQVLAVGNPDGFTSPTADRANLVAALGNVARIKSFLGY